MHEHIGHTAERARILEQLQAGTLPQILALVGPEGAGKEHLARWIAQSILCEPPTPDTAATSMDLFGTAAPPPPATPCGTCRQCRAMQALQHPDFSWHVPHETPKGSDDAKRRQYLDDRVAILAGERKDPVPTARESNWGFSGASVAEIVQDARLKPAVGARRVLLLSDINRLVTQTGQEAGANMLLKTLEEPNPQTTIIVTANELSTLVQTVRSRLSVMPVEPLDATDGTTLLKTLMSALTDEAARGNWTRSRGNVTRAVAFAQNDVPMRENAKSVLRAAWTHDQIARTQLAQGHGSKGARADYLTMLREAADLLLDADAVATRAPGRVADASWSTEVETLLASGALDRGRIAATGQAVLDAETASNGNAMPALSTHRLFRDFDAAVAPRVQPWARARLDALAAPVNATRTTISNGAPRA